MLKRKKYEKEHQIKCNLRWAEAAGVSSTLSHYVVSGRLVYKGNEEDVIAVDCVSTRGSI